ncbi:2-oxoglutarate (2OG) and Fe(II)-dependent oxygenase superfamily protein [Striga hermonthica]|uniref:2-oxoglutarate (2OG) and Fe(II)-dependent oxygenase superfamily protein n=1 Tax=Striga hermonthica TaxID=68872 RepID=A0A9N7MJT4_STRHE|nr:2-oxoglutarate (2OG) and Fe(II)-dependent oxygenase superfamily protein [Striga hermonthica]
MASQVREHEPSSATDSFVKVVAESGGLKSVPSQFTFENEYSKGSNYSNSIPTLDFSHLTSPDSDLRSKALKDLAHACQEGGFFVLINHGIPERVTKGVIEASLEFFNLPDHEKKVYKHKSPSDPIKCGSGALTTTSNHRIRHWRDFLKTYVSPHFHCPENPPILGDILLEYSEKTRHVARTLLQGIGENLELEQGYIDRALQLDSSFQQYSANYYPPCPEPDHAIGIMPHSDHGLLTFLIHNGVAGLQIQHNGEWFEANSPHGSIWVHTADHLEIFSNGRYKSVNHRALVNNQTTRISVIITNASAPETIVGPAGPLVERDGRALYRPMKFIEYLETKPSKQFGGKSNLDCVKIDAAA